MHVTDAPSLTDRLCAAVNARDLEAVVDCFAPDYRNETPAHPKRGFTGRDQVRANWQQIFAVVPDIEAEVLRTAIDGDTVWSEWEHRGHRPDGTMHVMRGVIIFGVVGGLAAWARFYLEPVAYDGDGVDEFRRRQLGVER